MCRDNLDTRVSVSAKYGKTGNPPTMWIFTQTISSYFRPPPPITQKLSDLHTWNFACQIRPTGAPRIPNLPIITEMSKIQCRMVSPQVIEKNQSLFLILTWFLHVFSEGNGKENNAVAMVTYKISSQIFSISQREAYPFLIKLG